MKFVQYYLDCLSQASYLVADEASGRAAVVDPRRDIQEYLDDVAASGLSIDYVIETHARIRLARVGLDSVAGALDQPEAAFVDHPEVTGTASRLTARQLVGARAAVPGLVLLDVRGPGERDLGYVEDSMHIPLAQLRERIGELDPAQPLVIYCADGYRSSIAASLLRASGFADVSDLIGGYEGWLAA